MGFGAILSGLSAGGNALADTEKRQQDFSNEQTLLKERSDLEKRRQSASPSSQTT